MTATPATSCSSPCIRALRTRDADEWTAVLGRAVRHDFHHLPQYHRVAEQHGEGTAHLFVYEEDEHVIALPLLLRPVESNVAGEWQDATSVYGYAGPVSSHEKMPAAVVERFRHALAAELIRRGVAAVFSRLHPLLAQRELIDGLGEIRETGQTISIDLTAPPEEQAARYNKSCRTTLRKLRRMGFVAVHDREKRYLPDFVAIYQETMRRVAAAGSYLFDEAYFSLLTQELSGVSELFVVLAAGQVAAATLCTFCNGIVQDHLGGTRGEFLRYSPDRLVVDAERLWAKDAGAEVLHLGGGVGAQQDSVFRYKAGFSDRRHTFCTWRWIVQPGAYSKLCADRAAENKAGESRPAATDFFPEYRCPRTPNEEARAPESAFPDKEGHASA
jgi:hypothetical protein